MEKDTNSILNNVATSQSIAHIGEHVAAFDQFNETESAAIMASTFSRKVQRERANAQNKLNQLIKDDAKGKEWVYIEWYLNDKKAWTLATKANPTNPEQSIKQALKVNCYSWVPGDGSGDEPEGHWTVD